MSKTRAVTINRRRLLATAGAATSTLAAPRVLRAQGKELVVGGAASHKNLVETVIAPVVEKKLNCKVVFEGSRSLVNLEKMQKNKDKQYLSVVMMDDPVMIPAVAEGLLEKLTAAKVPNLAMLKPGTVHMDGMWCNYLQPWLGIAYNPKALKTAPASWADIYDPTARQHAWPAARTHRVAAGRRHLDRDLDGSGHTLRHRPGARPLPRPRGRSRPSSYRR